MVRGTRRQSLRRSEAERADAVKTARKLQLASALHKSSRDLLQRKVDEMEEELANASPTSVRDEDSTRSESGGRGLFGVGANKRTMIAFDEDSDRVNSFPSAGGGGGGGVAAAATSRKGSVFAAASSNRKGSVMAGMTNLRKGAVMAAAEEESVEEGGLLSDVDDEKAVALLAKCQECSAHFNNFTPTSPPKI